MTEEDQHQEEDQTPDPLASEEEHREQHQEQDPPTPPAPSRRSADRQDHGGAGDVVQVPAELWEKLTKVVEGGSGKSLVEAIDEALDAKAHRAQHDQIEALISEREEGRKEPGALAKLFGFGK